MFKALPLVLLLLSSGCAMFDGNEIPDIVLSERAANVQQKPSVSFTTMARGGLGTPKTLPENGQKKIAAEFRSVLEASNYFSSISNDDDSADVIINAEVTESGNPAAMIPAMITGFSLYTIPSWADSNLDILAKVKAGDQSKEYTAGDSTKLVQWLPMALAFPFKNFSVISDVRENMFRKILSDIESDGLLE